MQKIIEKFKMLPFTLPGRCRLQPQAAGGRRRRRRVAIPAGRWSFILASNDDKAYHSECIAGRYVFLSQPVEAILRRCEADPRVPQRTTMDLTLN